MTVEISDDPARVDVDVVHDFLANHSYWAAGIPRSVVESSLRTSECWGAYEDGAMLGFARLVTDRATFAWLADVFVLPPGRGRGIGVALVEHAVRRARGYGVRRFMLATGDAHELYRRFGFTDSPQGLLMEITTPYQ